MVNITPLKIFNDIIYLVNNRADSFTLTKIENDVAGNNVQFNFGDRINDFAINNAGVFIGYDSLLTSIYCAIL